MEVLGRIVAIPAVLIGAMLAIVAVIAVIEFHEVITTVAVAFATDWIPGLISIVGDLVKGLVAELQKA